MRLRVLPDPTMERLLMPDGQLSSVSPFAPHHAAVQADLKTKARVAWKRSHPLPEPTALRLAQVLAHNGLLQSALDRQRQQSADLQCILSGLDIAALCLGVDLTLRLFTASASRLLGIGPGHLGGNVLVSPTIDPSGQLIAGIRVVLAGGMPQAHPMRCGDGPPLQCRVLPLRHAEALDAGLDGVILTFSAPSVAPSDAPPDGGLGAGYPQLGYGLTRRQHQVLGHVLAGHPSKNIAADLGISRRTVENHRAAIMARTGATSLPALARLAIGADVGGDCKPLCARAVSK